MKMSSVKKMNFIELIQKYKIVIPDTQRDYLHGFNKEILYSFINDIKNIKEELSFNLICGEVKDDAFYPSDGQQRLTLLFLLYLYSGRKDILKDKFSYESRTTSKEFVKQLIENFDKEKCNTENYIQNEEWFLYDWKFDITIMSMIKVLDVIHKEKIIENIDKITFLFFDTKEDLYIKINLRGKYLTEFENFKAHLFNKLNNEENIDKIDKFNSTYINYFFDKNKKDYDKYFMNLLYNIIINYFVKEDVEEFNKYKFYTYFDKYIKDNHLFKDVCRTLDFFVDNDYFNNDYFKLSKNEFEAMDYKSRLYLYFISRYYGDDFNKHSRIIKNLLENQENIIDFEFYKNFINFINDFIEKKDILKIDNNIEGLEEEQLKIKLINEGWEDLILKAESLENQDGQISFLLKMSLKNHNDKINFLDKMMSSNNFDKKDFEKYYKLTEQIFNIISKNNNIVIKNLLILEDGFIENSLLKSNQVFVKQNFEKGFNNTWKKYLKNNCDLFKKLLDTLPNDNVEKYLYDSLENYLKNGEKNLKYYFIKYFDQGLYDKYKICKKGNEYFNTVAEKQVRKNTEIFPLKLTIIKMFICEELKIDFDYEDKKINQLWAKLEEADKDFILTYNDKYFIKFNKGDFKICDNFIFDNYKLKEITSKL